MKSFKDHIITAAQLSKVVQKKLDAAMPLLSKMHLYVDHDNSKVVRCDSKATLILLDQRGPGMDSMTTDFENFIEPLRMVVSGIAFSDDIAYSTHLTEVSELIDKLLKTKPVTRDQVAEISSIGKYSLFLRNHGIHYISY